MKARGKKVIGLSLIVLGFVALWGCASGPAQVTEAQAAAALAAPPDQETYTLGPEDTIEVSVWKEPDLTKQIVIPPDGRISYPLIGEIKAAGLTVKQLRTEIHKRLEKFVSDANVTVILLKPQFYKIYVTGKVNKPGEFPVGRPPTVMQAISMAGGLTPFASPGSIVILRNVGGKEEVFPFNYKTVSKGGSLDQNRILMPGDVVVVP
jgi:polysaccharide biosynthesis/export protein